MPDLNKSKSLPINFFSDIDLLKNTYDDVIDELLAETSASKLILQRSYEPIKEYCPVYHLIWKRQNYSHKQAKRRYHNIYRRSMTV